MKFPKTIKTFLMDGVHNGRMYCELSNWTGRVYKIPRTMIKESSEREDLNKSGVYLLFGKDNDDKEKVYIGESEGIFDRLKQHLDTKEFFNEVVAVVSKDDNLNKAHIKFLEHTMYKAAEKAGRFVLDNTNVPKKSAISEADEAEMNEFFHNMKLLTGTLGYKVFEEIGESATKNTKKYYLKSARGADATGERTSEGFVVHKGSRIARDTTPSMDKSLIKKRQHLMENGKIKEIDGNLVVRNNEIFSSPSMAASIVAGRSANGLLEWKDKNGKSLRDDELAD